MVPQNRKRQESSSLDRGTVRSRLRRKQSRPRSRCTTKKPPPGADDLCIRVSLTVAERRELRIAAAKEDVSVGVLVRRLAMAALRRSADEQGGLNQTTDGAGALNVHAALTIADHSGTAQPHSVPRIARHLTPA
jgi:hypothetical protein